MTNVEISELASFEITRTIKGIETDIQVETFIDSKDVNQRTFPDDINTDVFSRITKVNGKGRHFHWELLLPATLDDLIKVYGKKLVFALAIRSLLTNFTNWIASMDLSKDIQN